MKKLVLILFVVLLLSVCLIPQKWYVTDGGSVHYKSLTYTVEKSRKLLNENEVLVGYRVEIFGVEVYDNLHVERVTR